MRIRAIEPEDLELLYTIENDMSLWWLGMQTAPLSRYHLRNYVANNEGDIYKDEQVRFVIEVDGNDICPKEQVPSLKDNGHDRPASEAVGLIDLFNFSPRHLRAELGIAVKADMQGHGIARRAIKEVIKYARDILNIHQIYAIVPASNIASYEMLKRNSFQEGLCLKDWINKGGDYEDAKVMQFFL